MATIAAPVFNQLGCVAMILAVHPLHPQTPADVGAIGRLTALATDIGT
ncbi:hypothetical protein [Mycolicibacterium hodleri]|nr:hypothetical protein [Mycolicibacterium hodleri]